MSKCPICTCELEEKEDGNFFCSNCDETIPKDFVRDLKIPCCDPLNPCK